MSANESVIVGSISLGLIAATSTPALWTICKSLFLRRKDAGYHYVDGLYADGDGVATRESQEQFSSFIPRCLALVASLIGLLLSIATAVLATIHPNQALFVESWLTLASWVGQVAHVENHGP